LHTYNLPGLFQVESVSKELEEVLPYLLNTNDINLYGTINFPWNSGRSLNQVAPSSLTEDVRANIDYELGVWSEYPVGIYLTFTSKNIDLSSQIGKYLLNYLTNMPNPRKGVILQNKGLHELINKEYPTLETVSSILKATNEHPQSRPLEYYSKALLKFDRAVFHPDDNVKCEMLGNLDPSRVEILANEVCTINCKVRKRHYSIVENTSKATTAQELHLAQLKEKELWDNLCPRGKEGEVTPYLDLNNLKELKELGIKNWKIQGRWQSHSTVSNYLECIDVINNL